MSEEKTMLTIPEVAEILRICRSKAYSLARNGEIPVIKLGRTLRVPASSLHSWMENSSIN